MSKLSRPWMRRIRSWCPRPEAPVSNGEKGASPPTFEGVSFFRTEMDGRNCRMAVVAPSEEEALTGHRGGGPACASRRRLLQCAEVTGAAGDIDRSRGYAGSYRWPLCFPDRGHNMKEWEGSSTSPFPSSRSGWIGPRPPRTFDLLRLLFHDKEENLQKTRWQQPAMFAMEHAMASIPHGPLGIHPVAMAGHSLGELTALCLAGVYSPEDGFRIVNKKGHLHGQGRCHARGTRRHGGRGRPPGSAERDDPGTGGCPYRQYQFTEPDRLSGNTEAVKDLCKRLKEMGHRTTFLRVSMAFHSPIMKVIHDELEAYIAGIPFHSPKIPVISNTTMALYPSDPDEIRRILMAHLENPPSIG